MSAYVRSQNNRWHKTEHPDCDAWWRDLIIVKERADELPAYGDRCDDCFGE